jgi:glutathione S-transferase
MTTSRHVTLFHAPNSRSSGALILLEELQADFDIHLLNMKAGELRAAPYLAINPMGKVPAVQHGQAIVTEQVAIFLFLADLYADRGLAPGLDDPLRGPYLRWMAFYGSCFEPAVVDKAMGNKAAAPSTSPYGDYDTMLGVLVAQLERGPYLLGERFTAVDVLWGNALRWTTMFGLVPKLPVIVAYMERTGERPAAVRALERDAEMAAQQGA